ncbi:MAG: hypothetical protein OXI27_08500 [Thaumarchaeota archaeon]|nr:hypothetical protein [Nitrososphaerota archaeon]
MNLAIDGTGPGPGARSEYIGHRHRVRHGFVRMVLAVDTDTREILAFSVTDDTVGESPSLSPSRAHGSRKRGRRGTRRAGRAGRAGRALWDLNSNGFRPIK